MDMKWQCTYRVTFVYEVNSLKQNENTNMSLEDAEGQFLDVLIMLILATSAFV